MLGKYMEIYDKISKNIYLLKYMGFILALCQLVQITNKFISRFSVESSPRP